MRTLRKLQGPAAVFAALAAMQQAGAQTSYVTIFVNDSESYVRSYWTPERIASAEPLEIEDDSLRKETGNARLKPEAVGTSGLHFTSTQVFPLTSNPPADQVTPYRAVGKMFFTIPGVGGQSCSASVINLRLVLTAAHCVSDGMGTNFTNFMFIPAFRQGMAPFGMWTFANVLIPTKWNGVVPNPEDFAILLSNDLAPIGQPARSLGSTLGFILGAATFALAPNDVVILGYPRNFDNGQIMHQVNAGQSTNGGSSTVLYGSDMGAGASGGPFIQNFGVNSAGQVGGGTNQVVGVVSTASTGGQHRIRSSILNSTFADIVQSVCAAAAGNCQ